MTEKFACISMNIVYIPILRHCHTLYIFILCIFMHIYTLFIYISIPYIYIYRESEIQNEWVDHLA